MGGKRKSTKGDTEKRTFYRGSTRMSADQVTAEIAKGAEKELAAGARRKAQTGKKELTAKDAQPSDDRVIGAIAKIAIIAGIAKIEKSNSTPSKHRGSGVSGGRRVRRRSTQKSADRKKGIHRRDRGERKEEGEVWEQDDLRC